MNTTTECPSFNCDCDGSGTAGHEADCPFPDIETCTNVEHDSCASVQKGEEPDMSLGDTCVLCCCWNCERCQVLIDLDCEIKINDGQRGPAKFQGFWVVCEDCVLESDTLYDDEAA